MVYDESKILRSSDGGPERSQPEMPTPKQIAMEENQAWEQREQQKQEAIKSAKRRVQGAYDSEKQPAYKTLTKSYQRLQDNRTWQGHVSIPRNLDPDKVDRRTSRFSHGFMDTDGTRYFRADSQPQSREVSNEQRPAFIQADERYARVDPAVFEKKESEKSEQSAQSTEQFDVFPEQAHDPLADPRRYSREIEHERADKQLSKEESIVKALAYLDRMREVRNMQADRDSHKDRLDAYQRHYNKPLKLHNLIGRWKRWRTYRKEIGLHNWRDKERKALTDNSVRAYWEALKRRETQPTEGNKNRAWEMYHRLYQSKPGRFDILERSYRAQSRRKVDEFLRVFDAYQEMKGNQRDVHTNRTDQDILARHENQFEVGEVNTEKLRSLVDQLNSGKEIKLKRRALRKVGLDEDAAWQMRRLGDKARSKAMKELVQHPNWNSLKRFVGEDDLTFGKRIPELLDKIVTNEQYDGKIIIKRDKETGDISEIKLPKKLLELIGTRAQIVQFREIVRVLQKRGVKKKKIKLNFGNKMKNLIQYIEPPKKKPNETN